MTDDSRERREVIPDWCFEEAARLTNNAPRFITHPPGYIGDDLKTMSTGIALARLVQQQCKPPVDEAVEADDEADALFTRMMDAPFDPSRRSRDPAVDILRTALANARASSPPSGEVDHAR